MNAKQSPNVSIDALKSGIDYPEVFEGVCRSPLECAFLSVARGERVAADEQYILLEQAADVLEICQAHIFDNDNANGGGFSAKALAGAIGLAAGVVRASNQITEAQARHETRVQFSRGCAK